MFLYLQKNKMKIKYKLVLILSIVYSFNLSQTLNQPTLNNYWILHTTSNSNDFIIAPRKDASSWNWNKQIAISYNTANIGINCNPSLNDKLTISGNVNVINDINNYPKIGFHLNETFPNNSITPSNTLANYGLTKSENNTLSVSGWYGINFYTNYQKQMMINSLGQVGIGISSFPQSSLLNNFKLFVVGGILADEIKIQKSNNKTWADYVFHDNYKLLSLDEVDEFIKKNKHLPNMPNEEQIKTEGINVAEILKIQQEKIEELTLYIIDLNKQVNELKKSK